MRLQNLNMYVWTVPEPHLRYKCQSNYVTYATRNQDHAITLFWTDILFKRMVDEVGNMSHFDKTRGFGKISN